VFLIGTTAIIGLDQKFRAQVALKENSSLCSLLGIICVCLIDAFAICSINGDVTPVGTFLKSLDDIQAAVLGEIIWAVMVNGM